MAGSESVGTPNLENNGSEYQVTVYQARRNRAWYKMENFIYLI